MFVICKIPSGQVHPLVLHGLAPGVSCYPAHSCACLHTWGKAERIFRGDSAINPVRILFIFSVFLDVMLPSQDDTRLFGRSILYEKRSVVFCSTTDGFVFN